MLGQHAGGGYFASVRGNSVPKLFYFASQFPQHLDNRLRHCPIGPDRYIERDRTTFGVDGVNVFPQDREFKSRLGPRAPAVADG